MMRACLTSGLKATVKNKAIAGMLFTGLAVLGGFLNSANAAEVNSARAVELATNWIEYKTADNSDQPFVLRDTFRYGSESESGLHIVRFDPLGFVIISTDDKAHPLVGYSLDSEAISDVNHPAVSNMFDTWIAEIDDATARAFDASISNEWQQLAENPAAFAGNLRTETVPPLLSCNWDQGGGWNQLCPLDAAGPGGRVYAGCVAVSMAQIMKYWNQPLSGSGNHGFQSNYGYLSVNFGQADYDWAGMPDNSSNLEVAKLLYHCGVAVDMDYSPEGSGAFVGWGNPCAMSAMEDHFGFLGSLDFVTKDDYSISGWQNILKDELDAGRPTVYRGYGPSGGHAFNMDGYDENDYFHFNWGWSGSYNGWFTVESLTPGSSSFSLGQGAIIGLEPENYHPAPAINGPLDGSTEVPAFPVEFSWIDQPGVDYYEVKIDSNDDFNTAELIELNTTENFLSIQNLDYYHNYYWRVRCVGINGVGPWSSMMHFTTEFGPYIAAPEIVNPAENAINVACEPTIFVWGFVVGGESYGLQVAEDAEFAELVVDESGIDSNFYICNSLLPETEYYWRANVLGPPGHSDWTTTLSFITISEMPVNQVPTAINTSTGECGDFAEGNLFCNALAEISLDIDDADGDEVNVLVEIDYYETGSTEELSWNLDVPVSFALGQELDCSVFEDESVVLTVRIEDVHGAQAEIDGCSSWTRYFTALADVELPAGFSLEQNFPNPFNPTTTINYSIDVVAPLHISIVNILGQLTETLYDGVQTAGNHQIQWDASLLQSGVYFCLLESAGKQEMIKMVLAK
jgi:hypothetical protein